MKHSLFPRLTLLFVLMAASAASPRAATTDPARYVQPLPERVWQRPLPTDPLAVGTRSLLETTCRYALNSWRDSVKGFTRQTGQYFDFGGRLEKHIRPVSHEAFLLAFALRWGICRPEVTGGVSRAEAQAFCCRLIESMAYRHVVNCGKGGWGDQWQSALWAAQGALAAWALWPELSPEARTLVARVVEHEANRFIDYRVPYYRDRKDSILSPGDTKAEENAWNSNILTAAINMMPHHPNRRAWERKNYELQISAYATPTDARSRRRVDGHRLCNVLQGSNINDDGTLVNHGIMHPDYMVAFMHNGTNAWVDRLGGRRPLAASTHNGALIYRALTSLQFDGRTIYVRTADGQATPRLYFPQGNDWGTGRQANYWLMDVMADVFGFDRGLTPTGYQWALARTLEMQRRIARSGTGRYYMSLEENSFDSREEWLASHLAWGYLGLWLSA